MVWICVDYILILYVMFSFPFPVFGFFLPFSQLTISY